MCIYFEEKLDSSHIILLVEQNMSLFVQKQFLFLYPSISQRKIGNLFIRVILNLPCNKYRILDIMNNSGLMNMICIDN